MTSTLARNPFVGPRPLQTGEPLHGRDREIDALVSEFMARRVVVLHAASGAGKSSLVQAGLTPKLKAAEFDVWRPIRVCPERARAGELPEGANPYILSAITSLEDELPAERRRSPSELAHLDFAEYVEQRPRRRKRAHQQVALIFDQLEDVLSPGTRPEIKREFFEAVGELLENDRYWGLLVVRDEQLAQLTLHHRCIPTHLSNTFHLDPLSLDGATEAATQLAKTGGRSMLGIDDLIRDLSRVELEDPDGSLAMDHSPWVDPMHLQVACRRLWDATPSSDSVVDCSRFVLDVDINAALSTYYGDTMRAIAKGDAKQERELRDWVARTLIVGSRCGQLRGDELARGGPDERRLIELSARGLVRVEDHGGVQWLELGHQRLVAAIQANNAAWDRNYPRVLAKLQELLPSATRPGSARSLDASEESWIRRSHEGARSPLAAVSHADSEASERSWITRSGEPLVPRDEPPQRLPAASRALATDVGRRLLEASAADGSEALLGAALATLAQDDPSWTALAMTARDVLDVELLLELLRGALTQLADPQGYASLPEREQPGLADLIGALLDLGQALRQARGAYKRELLLAAFRASFRPEYFSVGLTPHLWELARRIEYPELHLLEKMLGTHGAGVRVGMQRHELEAFFIRKLCELGLASFDDPRDERGVVLSEMAPTFRSFLIAGRTAAAPASPTQPGPAQG